MFGEHTGDVIKVGEHDRVVGVVPLVDDGGAFAWSMPSSSKRRRVRFPRCRSGCPIPRNDRRAARLAASPIRPVHDRDPNRNCGHWSWEQYPALRVREVRWSAVDELAGSLKRHSEK